MVLFRIFLFFLIFETSLYSTPPLKPLSAKLEFKKFAFDFGVVKKNSLLEKRFFFKNIGTSSLKIEDVFSSCSCAQSSFDSSILIDPGKEGFFDLRISTQEKEGELLVPFLVHTNEEFIKNHLITLKANISSNILLKPRTLELEQGREGFKSKKTVFIKESNEKNLVISSIDYNKKRFSLSLKKINIFSYELEISLLSNNNPGYYHDVFTFFFGKQKKSSIKLSVKSKVFGNIFPEQTSVQFGKIKRHEYIRKSVGIELREPNSLRRKIKKLFINGKSLGDFKKLIKVYIRDLDLKNKILDIEIQNDSKLSGSIQGEIILSLADKKDEFFPIHFEGFFL